MRPLQVPRAHKRHNARSSFFNMLFLTTIPGHALVDTAAGRPIIGKSAIRDLEKRLQSVGFKCVRVPKSYWTETQTSGVGGSAGIIERVLVPCVVLGFVGVIEFAVLGNDVPPLIPCYLLKHIRAVIYLENMQARSARGTQKLHEYASGHVSVDITTLNASDRFEVPESLLSLYPFVSRDSFSIKDSVDSSSHHCSIAQHDAQPTYAYECSPLARGRVLLPSSVVLQNIEGKAASVVASVDDHMQTSATVKQESCLCLSSPFIVAMFQLSVLAAVIVAVQLSVIAAVTATPMIV